MAITLDKGLRSASVQRTFGMIKPSRADGFGGTEITPNEAYVTVAVTRMQLTYGRELFKEYYPVVHSFIEMDREGSDSPIVPFVAGPGQLAELTRSNESRIVFGNIPVLGPTPYIGGDLKLAAALCAVESKDYLDNLLGVLGSISGIVGGTALSTALTFIEPLKAGAEKLLGMSDDVEVKVGLVHNFGQGSTEIPGGGTGGSALVDGYFAVVNVDEKLDWGRWLHLIGGRLHVEYKDGAILPVEQDHAVIKISQNPTLPQWSRIKGLDELRKSVLGAALDDGLKSDDYREALGAFKKAVIANGDLVRSDRVAIVRGIEKEAADYATDPPVELQVAEDEDVALARTAELGR